jgi:Fe-S-cluster containining protein
VKRIARWSFYIDVSLHRALRRVRGDRPHRLGGECRRCARCCEAPAIQVGRAVWYLPALRRLFLWWQRRVNGFELARRDVRARVFVFECTHFDRFTRSCDSYDSRPGICRDYPRNLLAQPNPEMLPGCGYRPVAPNAEALLRALEGAAVRGDQIARLKKDLHLEK